MPRIIDVDNRLNSIMISSGLFWWNFFLISYVQPRIAGYTIVGKPPLITEEPLDTILVESPRANLSLTCRVTGDPQPTVTWFMDNSKLVDSAFVMNDGSLLIPDYPSIISSDTTLFYCRASNEIGEDGRKFTATIRSKTAEVTYAHSAGFIEDVIQVINVAIGSNVAIKCPIITTEESRPYPIIEWWDNYNLLIDPEDDTDNMFYLEGGLYLAIVGLIADQVSSERAYWCRVTNAGIIYTEYSYEYTLNNSLAENILVDYKQIGNITAFVTDTEVEFSYIGGSSGAGNPGIFAQCELFDGNQNRVAILTNVDGIGIINMNQIPQPITADRNEFTIQCQIGYSAGTTIRRGNLKFYQRAVITNSPQDNREFVDGCENIVYVCEAEGIPTPKIEWFINGNDTIPSDSGIKVIDNILTITQPTFSHSGMYQCVATNEFAADIRTWVLEVRAPLVTTNEYTNPTSSSDMSKSQTNMVVVVSTIVGIVCSLVFCIGGIISVLLMYCVITRCKCPCTSKSQQPKKEADQSIENMAYYEDQ